VFSKKNAPAIVCFAGCDWWYHNRGLFCPQVISRLAKQYKVVFVNSLGMRLPRLSNDKHALKKIFRKLKSILRFIRRVDNGMYVFTPISLPLLGNPTRDSIIKFFLLLQVKLMLWLLSLKNPVFYMGCPPAWEIVKKLHRRYLIYQRTDIFEEMPGANKDYIATLDDTLVKVSDLVMYVNTALWRQGKEKNANSLLIGHGVDFESFSNALSSNHIPEDIDTIRRPIIGFFGDVTEDVCDFSLLEHVAKTLPDMSLVLIGPISSDVSNLRKYDNVFFLGQKPHEEVPHYGKMFNVAIMPWRQNKWIEFCNPVKIKEYLALGKPIVSIDYPELEPYYDIVYAVSGYDGFVDAIQKALAEHDPDLRRRRQERVKNETWENKVKQIREFIEQKRIQTEGM